VRSGSGIGKLLVLRAHPTALIMLRKKLRNSTILVRTAPLGRASVAFWPLLGWSVLYVSMINAATMEENKEFCKAIVRDCHVNL
jgi:hypothetical protein